MQKQQYRSANFIKYFVNQKLQKDYLENGGAYMANMRYETEYKNLLNSSQTKTLPSSLKEKFEGVNKKYQEKLSYWQGKQDEQNAMHKQFEDLAGDSLSEFKQDSIDKIYSNFGEKEKTLNDKKSKQNNSFLEDKKNLNTSFEKAKEDLKYEAIDKGWRNSSIYENMLTKLELSKSQKSNNLDEKHRQKMLELDFQKKFLEEQKQDALQKFDIAYAQKLSKKLAELENEYQKQNKQLLNDIKQGLYKVTDNIQGEKAAIVLSEIKKMNKKDAKLYLDNDEIKNELGQNWFNLLVAWVDKNK